MFLLTWHGTLLTLRGEGGGLTHAPVASAAPLDLELPAACTAEPQRVRTLLGTLDVQPVPGRRGVSVSRFGQFLYADAQSGEAAFDRISASFWETFLPVSVQDLAALRHILAHGWICQADRRFIAPRAVRIAPGFRLMLGDAELDLAQRLPLQGADPEAALPETIQSAASEDWGTLVMAGPRGSALLESQRWPTRARQNAETIVLALRRHLEGSEPGQAVFDRDVAALMADGGVPGLSAYLDRCLPAACIPAAPADDGRASAASAAVAAAAFTEGVTAHEAGDYGAAVASWSACLAADPSYLNVRKRLGEVLIALGRPLAALPLLEAAAEAAPSDSELALYLAARYGYLGWWDRAHAMLPESENGLTGWLLQTFRHVRATFAKHSETAARLSSAGEERISYEDRLLLCQTRLMLGDVDGADAAAEALLRERPGQFPPHRVRAETWVRRAGAPAGVAYLRALDVPFGNGAPHRLLLGRLLIETQDYPQACRVLKPLLDGQHRSAAFRLVALAAFCEGDMASFAELSLSWLGAGTRETQAAVFTIAACRTAGRLPRLADGFARQVERKLRIIQFWHEPELPADVAAAMASWPARNPGLEHVIFNRDSARDFIVGHYGPQVLELYDNARHPAMQSDLFRLAYLAERGGVYVDADEHCIADMGDVFAALLQVQLVAWLSHETFPYLYNGFLAAAPGSVILRNALKESVHLLTAHRAAGTRTDMWAVTGPGLITRAVGKRLTEACDVLLLKDSEYRGFAQTLEDLAYKKKPEGNWRTS